jgi:hypothetical protein
VSAMDFDPYVGCRRTVSYRRFLGVSLLAVAAPAGAFAGCGRHPAGSPAQEAGVFTDEAPAPWGDAGTPACEACLGNACTEAIAVCEGVGACSAVLPGVLRCLETSGARELTSCLAALPDASAYVVQVFEGCFASCVSACTPVQGAAIDVATDGPSGDSTVDSSWVDSASSDAARSDAMSSDALEPMPDDANLVDRFAGSAQFPPLTGFM